MNTPRGATRNITEEEFWQDGYDTGHRHGLIGLPNTLDVLGRRMAEVIPLFNVDELRTGPRSD